MTDTLTVALGNTITRISTVGWSPAQIAEEAANYRSYGYKVL